LLRIRLTRRGAKKNPHYRVVVTEKSSPRDGRFQEIVGHYNPALEPGFLLPDEHCEGQIGKVSFPLCTLFSR